MGRAMILELKVAKKFSEMESKCEEGLKQIEEQDFGASLLAEGYRPILKYSVSFYRKGCMVKNREA
ncbi:MAG: hypothetical protein HFE73_03665 [Firmicutes bacterium]|jgi:hypothetical protein|nr:hypothetical protein [Bacillota bacterium]